MTEQTTQRAPPEGSVPEHELNHRVNNEVAAAVSVEAIAKAAATGKPARALQSFRLERRTRC